MPAQLHQRLVHEVVAAPPMQELALSRVGGGGAHAGGGRREVSAHRVGWLTRRAFTAAALSLLLSSAGGLPGRRARVDELRRVRTGCLGRRGGADGWDVIHLRRTSERVGARIFFQAAASAALLPPQPLQAVAQHPATLPMLKVRPRLPQARPALRLCTASPRHRCGLLAIFLLASCLWAHGSD